MREAARRINSSVRWLLIYDGRLGAIELRSFQILLFILGMIALSRAAITWMNIMGLVFWHVGVAVLLVDVVCLMLWPTKR